MRVTAGMVVSPLTFLRLVRMSFRGWLVAVCRAAAGAVGVLTGLGWSGRCGGRSAGGLEQVHPLVLAVPVLGHVHGDVAPSVPGGAGGDVDEVTAQRGSPGPGAGETGQGSSGA